MIKVPMLLRLLVTVLVAAMPALAAHWSRVTSANFELYTPDGEKQGIETIRHLEQVREFFSRASPVRISNDVPLRIFQFESEAEFRPFRPNGFTAAFYLPAPGRDYIVLGDQAVNDYGIAIHEYMHLIVRHSGLKLPTWLNEGWADVYSTLRPMGKDTAVGDLRADRMKTLTAETWLDFDTLTSTDARSPVYHEGSRIGIFYAESWALAHMLYLSPEYKDNFGKFITALNGGKSAAEACEIAFGKSSATVYQDLQAYFGRKRIFGRVFEAKLESKAANPVAAELPEFEARLAVADLLAATGQTDKAREEYARLEQEQPGRADMAQSEGDLAFGLHDLDAARRYFAKSFEAGNADPRMCLQLAALDVEAKEPAAKIIPILERALQSKPDMADAKLQLGLMQIQVRDFSGAIANLMALPTVTSRLAPSVFCGLAYAFIQTGDVASAVEKAETCRKWARTESDSKEAARFLRFVDARAKPSAGVRAGEKLQRTVGIAYNLQCSPQGNRLQILVGEQVVTFDLPDLDAVEMPVRPIASLSLTCGAQKPVRLGVEFAPPRSAMETSLGIVRRLQF